MKNPFKNMNPKQWKKIVGYLIPVIALVVANAIGVDDPTQIEDAITLLVTAVLGVLASIGIVSNNDKDDKPTGQ